MEIKKSKNQVRLLRRVRGFTLVELMITVLIVAILTSIAYPAYSNYVMRSKRADATSTLNRIAAAQEQFFLDNKTYTADLTDLGFSADPHTTDHDVYEVAIEAATAACPITTCFSVKATAINNQVNDSCGDFTITSLGAKTPADCW